MDEFTAFVANNGYWLVAGWVFLDQMGLPIPAIPVLIAGGALAGTGQLDFGLALVAATAGAIPSDLIWYEAGRRRGGSVLRFLCRVSLEPDSCVNSTEMRFARYGPQSLLIAKFLPGYQTLAPPLAGMAGMPLTRFLLFDVPGAALYGGVFLGLGVLFHNQIDAVYQLVSDLGGLLLVIVFGPLAIYITWKWIHRQRFIRGLRTARIEPQELHDLIADASEVALFDLRNALELEIQPSRIPGAQVVSLEDLDQRHGEIPRDREIILYCN